MTALTRFSVSGDGEPVADLPKYLLTASVTYDGHALSFDQSIAKTGWSVLRSDRGEAGVWATGVIVPPETGLKGHANTLARGRYIFINVLALIEQYMPTVVLHELPPAGGRMSRPESSLASAMAVQCAAEHVGLPVGIFQNQHVKKVMLGYAKDATKAHVQAAVLKLWPDLKERVRVTQDVTDSIAGGLVWMKEN